MDPAPAQEPPVVTAADLRMSYGEKEVLKGLDFEVRRGEVVALLGPNGAGKTTTIRAKSVPHGMRGYVVGQSARVTYETVFGSAIILVAATVLIDGLWHRGLLGLLGVVGLIVLGLLACAPIGFVLGSIFKNPRSVGGWGMVVIGALVYASGIFSTGGLPRWVEVIGQLFPLHWLAAGMRAALLPDWAATLEPGGEWRVWQAVAVLAVWTVIGLVLAPRLLQRMARRESGSAVAARRDKALTRV